MDNLATPQSWEEAFETQKIPAVRAIETRLRAGVSRDKEKLRALVGGNYRGLLSTADQIVELDEKTTAVEVQIAETGRKCKPPEYEHQSTVSLLNAGITTQIHLLTRCILYGRSTLDEGSVILSVKLLVIARLLIKSLGDNFSHGSSLVEHLRIKATSLRRTLLRKLDIDMTSPWSTHIVLVNALCAYCLATSASSSDALKHFRELRLDRLKQRLAKYANDGQKATENFRYLMHTIQSFQSLYSRSVHTLLESLQQRPILDDTSIQNLHELSIDHSRGLIPKDIVSFTPYIKQVTFTKSEVKEEIQNWTVDASNLFAKSLAITFGTIVKIEELFKLRRTLLNVLLPTYYSTYTQKILLTSIRQASANRMQEICQKQIEDLQSLAQKTATSIPGPAADSRTEIWNTHMLQSITNSRDPSAHSLRNHHLGTSGKLDKHLKRLKKWIAISTELRQQTATVRSIRWQDIIEDPSDDDEEQLSSAIIAQLGEEDVRAFEATIQQSLDTAIARFQDIMKTAVADALTNTEDTNLDTIVYFIRLIRESVLILNPLTGSSATSQETTSLTTTATSLLSNLHTRLSSELLTRLSAKFETSSATITTPSPTTDSPSPKSATPPPPSQSTPDLPLLPSPLTFSVIRHINLTMSELGGLDIWSAAAMSILKPKLLSHIEDDKHRGFYTRNEFDQCYLRIAMGGGARKGDDTGVEDAAAAYWTRTKLLFGMLS